MVSITTKYLNALILMPFVLLWHCLIKQFGYIYIFFWDMDNIILSLLKIGFIWCDKLICNFKYIYINKMSFILKNGNKCGAGQR